MPVRKTIEEIKKQSADMGFELLSEVYVNNITPLTFKCPKGHVFERSWATLQKYKTCRVCSLKIIADSKRLSFEQVKQYVEEQGYELLDESYADTQSFLNMKCPLGHTTKIKYNKFQQGQRCTVCYEERFLTLEKISKRIFEWSGYMVLTTQQEFKNREQKLRLVCDKGHEYETTYQIIKDGHRCPFCQRRRYTYDMVCDILKEENYTTKELEYINNYTKMRFVCPKGHEWISNFRSFVFGYRCPQCSQSNGEKKVALCLDKLDIQYIVEHSFEDCRHIHPLRFDFYVRSHNLVIEYDGRQHFEPIEYFGGEQDLIETKKRDSIKTKYCEDNGINILRIPYFKHDEVESIVFETIKKIKIA